MGIPAYAGMTGGGGIPAYAGMTGGGGIPAYAGMTVGGGIPAYAGMTVRAALLPSFPPPLPSFPRKGETDSNMDRQD